MTPNDVTPIPTTGAMGSGTSSYPECGDKSRDLRGRVSGFTHQARDKATEFGRTAAMKIDRNIDNAVTKLENTASKLRNKTLNRGERVNRFANATADRLDNTASYFRTHHTREMVDDAGQTVRRNPAASMAVALAIGFMLGSSLRRDRY